MSFIINVPSTSHLAIAIVPAAKRADHSILFNWPNRRHFPERTAEPEADMPGDHTDTRSQRLHFLLHDRFARSILLPPPRRTGTEYVRTFSYLVSTFSSPLLLFLSIASGSPNSKLDLDQAFARLCALGEGQQCCKCRQADSSVGIWTARECHLY